MKTRLLALALMLLVLHGESHAQQPTGNQIATNSREALTFRAPPEGFSAVTASDEQLAAYGFPPRPDQGAAPGAYASWARAMRASQTRVAPILEKTNLFHGPVRLAANTLVDSGGIGSNNWSGYADLNNSTRFGSTAFYLIAADLIVPVAQQAFGACSASYSYGSSWVGMDGVHSNDVLQAGIEFDAACTSAGTQTFYAPWFEWFPSAEMRITNLPIAPGDDIYLEVWNTSATQGNAYLVNENTNKAVTLSFQPPAGTKLIGNSMEWITERPDVNNEPATLTNYIVEPFWNAYGVTHNRRSVEPAICQEVTMFDDNVEISYPTLLGDAAFVVQNTAAAR